MVQVEVFSILFVSLAIAVIIILSKRQLDHYQAGQKPKGFALYAIVYVQTMLGLTESVMGKKRGRMMAIYIGAIFIYILLSNWVGLLGIKNPTANYSVTFSLALVTWVWIQATKISSNGLKGYIGSFFKPFFFFVIPNVFSTIAPLISLSMRMFGNLLSGTIIMTMLYSFTGWLSGYIPFIGGFDLVGVIVAPWLHLYFDLFSGFLQAFLFISLTSIFIAVEYKEE